MAQAPRTPEVMLYRTAWLGQLRFLWEEATFHHVSVDEWQAHEQLSSFCTSRGSVDASGVCLPPAEYVVGSDQGWSDLKSFMALPSGTDWSPRLAVFGDMGVEGARSLER